MIVQNKKYNECIGLNNIRYRQWPVAGPAEEQAIFIKMIWQNE